MTTKNKKKKMKNINTSKEINKDINRNGITIFAILILGVIYALVFPTNSVYLGPTMAIFLGVLVFLGISLPSKLKFNKLNNQILEQNAFFYKKSLNGLFIVTTVMACTMIFIGILFSILCYFNLV